MVMKILIVEDTELAAMIAGSLLKSAGHDVDIANTGEKGVAMAAQNKYQLVFMDIGLPGIDGFTAANQIYTADPSIKIIGLTAHAIDDDYNQRAHQAHFVDMISKPLTKNYIENLPAVLSA